MLNFQLKCILSLGLTICKSAQNSFNVNLMLRKRFVIVN